MSVGGLRQDAPGLWVLRVCPVTLMHVGHPLEPCWHCPICRGRLLRCAFCASILPGVARVGLPSSQGVSSVLSLSWNLPDEELGRSSSESGAVLACSLVVEAVGGLLVLLVTCSAEAG